MNPTGLQLYMATTSTLLTIAIPEICNTREEQHKLLRSPQGFWVVLAVNGSSRFAADEGRLEHRTPCAQYVRGITSSLSIQRYNAEGILDILRQNLEIGDDGSLFDDEDFSKSHLYHWTVRTCDEVRNSISGTLRFIQRIEKAQLDLLRRDAHPVERSGLDHWISQLHDEISALEDVQDQISALNAQVQEGVSTNKSTIV
jgi:hypothetical protein